MELLNKQDDPSEKLLGEAKEILRCEDLNSQRERLVSIFDRIVQWREEESKDSRFFDQFQEMMMAMMSLNFSKKLPINTNQKSLQNLISYSLNMVNQELQDKTFSKVLFFTILKELDLKDKIIIITDYQGIIQFVFTGIVELPSIPNGFEGKKLNDFFDNMKKIDDLSLYEPIEGTKVNFIFGENKRPVNVKLRSTPFKISEGLAYIVELI